MRPTVATDYDAAAMTERVVLVTGAAGGIGRAVAERFLSKGDAVALADVDDERLIRLLRSSRARAAGCPPS
jgi:2-hydroxycyclohexanecarboxyl-CoA dehydrogenase